MTVVKLISSLFQLCEPTARVRPERSTPAGDMDFRGKQGGTELFSHRIVSHVTKKMGENNNNENGAFFFPS